MTGKYAILLFSFAYLALLFLIAWISERQSGTRKSMVNNPYVYALSLAVYCTAWTFYGSVGRASDSGIEFLAIYIGPTLTAPLWWLILRKIIRISKVQRISNLADFVSARYGKNITIGGIVTAFSAFGIIPYIALQIKAIAASIGVMARDLDINYFHSKLIPFYEDTSFYITIILALFVILFGTSQIESNERHEGLVTAVAFESVFKLIAFLLVGVFLSYFLFDDMGDVFLKAADNPDLKKLFTLNDTNYSRWFTMILLSMSAIFFLPRQFQMAVVENVDENHLKKAAWLFPLYLVLINLFVLPIAIGGNILFDSESINSDNLVLAIPLYFDQGFLAMIIYLGGLSAASGMVIVSTISLSIMLTNNLVLPLLLSISFIKDRIHEKLGTVSLLIRHLSILIILFLAFFYYKWVTRDIGLVSIGLISFAAVAQFTPVVIGGIFWKSGTRKGAVAALIVGFILWFYTLVVPTIVHAGFISEQILTEGLFEVFWLKPEALFGLSDLDALSHGAFWSLILNTFTFIIVSMNTRQSSVERNQAEIFVDIFKYSTIIESSIVWKGRAYIRDLKALISQFFGEVKAENFVTRFQNASENTGRDALADQQMVNYAESLLAGVIGVSSARIMVSSVVKEEKISMNDVFGILRESQELIKLNNELKQKTKALKKATDDLKKAYSQLQEVDHRKDEFISTVTHELRTPLTSIRSFSEILRDMEDLHPSEKEKFLDTIIAEADRMERLISQVLDIEKIQSGKVKLHLSALNINEVIKTSLDSMVRIFENHNIKIVPELQEMEFLIWADKDRLQQLILNLLSNAVKFGLPEGGIIKIGSYYVDGIIKITVADNGKGISKENQQYIFEPFFQAKNQTSKKPKGSGLGLAICKSIVELHKGRISVRSTSGQGAKFVIELPVERIFNGNEREELNEL